MANFKNTRAGIDNKNNVRKSLGAIVLLADADTELLEDIAGDDGGLVDLGTLTDWKPLGMFSEDGLSFSKEVEWEEVLAHGYKTYVRRDATSESHSVSLTALEIDRKLIAELRHGIDLSEVVPDPISGTIKYTVPEIEHNKSYRLLAISVDYNKETGEEIYRAKQYRSVTVETYPEESWSADPLQAAFEFSAKSDDESSDVFDEFLAGPGVNPDELGYVVEGS